MKGRAYFAFFPAVNYFSNLFFAHNLTILKSFFPGKSPAVLDFKKKVTALLKYLDLFPMSVLREPL